MDWDYFDIIFCISMPESRRWGAFEQNALEVGLGGRIMRHPGYRFSEDLPYTQSERGHMGCAVAHKQILDYARREGVGRILVFEDDAFIKPWSRATLAASLPELPPDWRFLLLSADVRQPAEGELNLLPYSGHLYRVNSAYGTHAIAYNNTAFNWLDSLPLDPQGCYEWIKQNLPIDMHLFKGSDAVYITNPMAAVVRPSISQITGKRSNPPLKEHFYDRVYELQQATREGAIR